MVTLLPAMANVMRTPFRHIGYQIYAATFGSRINFSETPILLILLRKIKKIGVSEKYSLAVITAKDQESFGKAQGFFTQPQKTFRYRRRKSQAITCCSARFRNTLAKWPRYVSVA